MESRAGEELRRLALGAAFGLIAVAVGGGEVFAHHDLRQELTDLLGPNAWALYLIVPVPYVLFAILGYKIYKAVRASDPASTGQTKPKRLPETTNTREDSWPAKQ